MLERFTGQCEGVSSEKGSETGLKASEKAESLSEVLLFGNNTFYII